MIPASAMVRRSSTSASLQKRADRSLSDAPVRRPCGAPRARAAHKFSSCSMVRRPHDFCAAGARARRRSRARLLRAQQHTRRAVAQHPRGKAARPPPGRPRRTHGYESSPCSVRPRFGAPSGVEDLSWTVRPSPSSGSARGRIHFPGPFRSARRRSRTSGRDRVVRNALHPRTPLMMLSSPPPPTHRRILKLSYDPRAPHGREEGFVRGLPLIARRDISGSCKRWSSVLRPYVL